MALNRRVNSQDVTYFLDLHRNGLLDLDPPFQRRSVWTRRDRTYFLDTIFRGYPSPSIYLSKQIKPNGESIFAVVDGKQRLETIIMYSEDKIVLRGYGDISVDGKKWSEIRQDTRLASCFLDYVLPVEQLTVGDDLNEVFDRLNRNNKNLNRQELRHAKYDGWFIEFVEKEAEDPFWREIGMVTTARARRMRDVQMLSELLVVVAAQRVRGFSQDDLDLYTARYQDASSAETDVDRKEDEVLEDFYRAKRYLQRIVAHADEVITYTKEARHLYSLWALICLSADLPSPSALAPRYVDFMKRVDELKAGDASLPSVRDEDSTEIRYSDNSHGPSTELPQRRARHQSLLALLDS